MLQAGFWAALAGSASGGGGGGGSYPNLTLTSPTFLQPGKFGSSDFALSAGSGTASSIAVSDTMGVGLWVASAGTSYGTIMQIQGFLSLGRAWDSIEIVPDGGGQGLSNTTAPSTGTGTPVINDGVYHWVYMQRGSLTGNVFTYWVDGTPIASSIGVSGQTNSLTFNISSNNLSGGTWFDEIVVWNGTDSARATPPTAPVVRDANTVVIWALNNNGVGS